MSFLVIFWRNPMAVTRKWRSAKADYAAARTPPLGDRHETSGENINESFLSIAPVNTN